MERESAGERDPGLGDSDESPLLSVVVTARNDDHGGNLKRRMQIFIDAFLAQAERHELNCELIITEWNPPPDRPRIVEAFAWPQQGGWCKVRIIEVPPHIHRRHQWSDRLPLFQMIAKNVGVRRARGRYVLCTNIDLVFSDELMQFLASGRLDPHFLYRIDRLDVPAGIPVGVPIWEQLEYCRRNVIRVNTRWGTFGRGELIAFSLAKRVWMGAILMRLRKLESVVIESARIIQHFLLWGLQGKNPRRRSRLWLGVIWARLVGAVRFPITWRLKPLHTNACGDFTLLARERWFNLRGYPEAEMFSIHLDSVFCNMAHQAGAREVVLHGKKCAYHIEHGSGWSPGEMQRLVDRMRAIGVPMLDHSAYLSWIVRMKDDPHALVVNAEDWGLASESLAETDPIAWNSQQRAGAIPAMLHASAPT